MTRMMTRMNDISLKTKAPSEICDVVIDTDAYNEIDDQFAIAYLLKARDRVNIKAIYAAPFLNARSTSPEDGMNKSYREILHLLSLANEERPVFRGSASYLEGENTPVNSDAARDLVKRACHYSPEHPLYVVAIGAITNVASAILMDKRIVDKIVVIWLGGHAHHYHDTKEFNMYQDIAAARVVMKSGVALVQLPCMGVVSSFTISAPELASWFLGKNPLADYLAHNTIEEMGGMEKSLGRSRCIWDLAAAAWLLNDGERFMKSCIIPTRIPTYEGIYSNEVCEHSMRYVYYVDRDALLCDMIKRLTE